MMMVEMLSLRQRPNQLLLTIQPTQEQEGLRLWHHTKSKHDSVKYSCNRCDYQAGYQSDLTRHIQSIHEGVRYACNQCDYQATQQGNLTNHIQYKHEGVKYAC